MATHPATRKPKAGSPKEVAARAQIVAVARRHFMAHGFRSVTMDDLAGELGMSKKTFYAHSKGKQSLVEAVLRQKLPHANADFERISEAGHGFPEVVHELLACV